MQTIQDNDVVIVSTVRTPIGKFNGGLSSISATELGAHAIKGALAKVSQWIKPQDVGEVFMGNVLSANLGQAPARQAALKAGLPESVPCTTVNKVCASGMKSIMFGALSIKSGQRDVVVCGGMENMSQVPYYLPNMRNGKRLGDSQCVDGMIKDGLWDVYNNVHMGNAGERCAKIYNFSREDQDAFAIESHTRAHNNKHLSSLEIVPVNNVKHDESVNVSNFDKLKKLKPVFGETVSAGNSSPLSDGAACVILVSGAFFKKQKMIVEAYIIRAFDDAAQKPMDFTTAPALVVPKLLEKSNLKSNQVDAWEINEAFGVVALANQKLLGLDPEKVNIFGGAVAIGHPIGCSGCRIIVTLCNVLKQKGGRYGCASICNGGGGASGIIIERVNNMQSKL
jgi:acetyl-CoA C-acetyltransferase